MVSDNLLFNLAKIFGIQLPSEGKNLPCSNWRDCAMDRVNYKQKIWNNQK